MLVTTTPNLEGKTIVEYKGLVFGEVIAGVNLVKDIFASITDIFGGRSGTYENELIAARESALAEMKQRAYAMGANGIVGIDVDYEVLGQNGSMLMVSVSGTAVVYED
ncbi:MAG TPA: heavy metal-binding domain-containing protein [Candidatus Cloacimonadota bacterium]|jgi:uncharacterized protein YbjQ (UPF0145 family)|nr:heavy metal-binding domain-containing protein [Candidatus Cloacimonadota bacterium]HOD53357.1 heavy metal-binding domain-containing protein [Candidatus Cloacimonadota bacterium]HPM02988.1 heavy metal-binding domain-containing protein [Candidatus Cloacimonadota bacterium]